MDDIRATIPIHGASLEVIPLDSLSPQGDQAAPNAPNGDLRASERKITLEYILRLREALYQRSVALIAKKGADYNRSQQQAGDTLYNLRVARLLGIVEEDTQSVMVRLCDKLMRLASLTKDPSAVPAIKDESVIDTVADVHNYVDYLLAFYMEARSEALDPQPVAGAKNGPEDRPA